MTLERQPKAGDLLCCPDKTWYWNTEALRITLIPRDKGMLVLDFYGTTLVVLYDNNVLYAKAMCLEHVMSDFSLLSEIQE